MKDEAIVDEFFRATRNGSLGKMKKLLENGYDINCKIGEVTSLLHAIAHNRFDSIQFLIENGIDNLSPAIDLWTPLFASVIYNRFSTAKLLLKHGGATSHRDRRGDSPLDVAMRKGNINFILLLIKHADSLDDKDKMLFSKMKFKANFKNAKSESFF